MADESKKFGAQGGKTRAANMTSEARKESARKAALARWGADLPVAEFDGVLEVGGVELPCAVLSDGSRVLSETEFMRAMGIYRSGALSVRREPSEGGARIPLSLAFKNLKPFVDKHLGDVHGQIRPFRTKSGSVAPGGISAEVIPKICEVWMDADRAGVLGPRQKLIATKMEAAFRAFAHVGIIALVDEATGFRRDQTREAVAQILKAFVQRELRPWVRTFPPEFYEELFRLRELPYPPANMKMPSYFGHITNNVVYDRLAPGVKAELKRVTPKDARGRPKEKFFQRLTETLGHPKLREHLASVIALMRVSPNWATFETFLNTALPRWDETLRLPLPVTPPLPSVGGADVSGQPLALPPASQPV